VRICEKGAVIHVEQIAAYVVSALASCSAFLLWKCNEAEHSGALGFRGAGCNRSCCASGMGGVSVFSRVIPSVPLYRWGGFVQIFPLKSWGGFGAASPSRVGGFWEAFTEGQNAPTIIRCVSFARAAIKNLSQETPPPSPIAVASSSARGSDFRQLFV
jgi:hypothetical protein